MAAKTMFDKIWSRHVVAEEAGFDGAAGAVGVEAGDEDGGVGS